MARITIQDQNRIKAACKAVDFAVASDMALNGIGRKKAAMLMQTDVNSAENALELAVAAGKLVAYRGRNGGSYRKPEEVRTHIQSEWGARTGHTKGEWNKIRTERKEAVENTEGALAE